MPVAATGKLAALRQPLAFDPGERWEYGINIDWVGLLVEAVSAARSSTPCCASASSRRSACATPVSDDPGAAGAAGAGASEAPRRQARAAAAARAVRAGILGRRRRAALDRARLSNLSRNAAAWRHAGRRAHPEAGNGRADEREPGRRPAGRRLAQHRAGAGQRSRPVSRGADALGSRLHAQHAARTERAQRRHGQLGRHLQQLLLARPGAPRRRRDPDADAALRRSRHAAASGRVRARRLCAGRGALTYGAAASAAPWPARSRRRRAGRPHAGGRADRTRPGRDRRRLRAVSRASTSPRFTPARLQRTRESAEIVSERLGLPIEFRDDLIELDFGEWTGTTFDTIRDDPRWQPWSQHRSLARIPGGETMRAVQFRAVEALLEIGERHPRRRLRHCQPRRRDPLGAGLRARHAARFLRPHRGRAGVAEHDPHRRRRHPRRLDQRASPSRGSIVRLNPAALRISSGHGCQRSRKTL